MTYVILEIFRGFGEPNGRFGANVPDEMLGTITRIKDGVSVEDSTVEGMWG